MTILPAMISIVLWGKPFLICSCILRIVSSEYEYETGMHRPTKPMKEISMRVEERMREALAVEFGLKLEKQHPTMPSRNNRGREGGKN